MPDHPEISPSPYAGLSHLLAAIQAAGRSVLPRADRALLETIVEAAARIFGAAAASIALVDESGSALVFQVAYGAGTENVVGMRIPLDKGLAGYVALTGQPLAISNVQQDQRFNQDFARSTGYVPKSILATPLLFEERVIGVMEVLDKLEAPAFGMQDMELLGLFARQAAMAIHQSQLNDQLDQALVDGLRRLTPAKDGELHAALDQASEVFESSLLPQIADQLYRLLQQGEAEQRLCLELLAAFDRYSQAKRLPDY